VQIRYFASGTGAAGLVGAFLWWEVRSLGVRTGVGLSSVNVLDSSLKTFQLIYESLQVLPFIIPIAYICLLPHPNAFTSFPPVADYVEEAAEVSPVQSYMPIATTEDEEVDTSESGPARFEKGFALSPADKWRLVKPMLLKYMLPLCELRFTILPSFFFSN
jgi:battenin